MELWNLWYASKWTFYQFFCRFVISKTCVTLLHMHRCQFYSAWYLIGSYCTGDWKLKILIAICSWHSITSRIGKILVANASKLVALYSTGMHGKISMFELTSCMFLTKDSEVGLDSPKLIYLLSFNGHDKLRLLTSFGINRCWLLMKLD